MPPSPGDPAFVSERTQSLSHSDVNHVSHLSFGSHAGTHLDPLLHLVRYGTGGDRLDLLNGPCLEVGVAPNGRSIGSSELPPFSPDACRVLFRTANSERWVHGTGSLPGYVALTPPTAEEQLRRGLRLVGIDSQSIEFDPEGRFPVHHLLIRGGAMILEGLRLADAPLECYELESLPARGEDGDDGPARTVLGIR